MSNIEDIENVRSFLFKLKDGTELKLVEKENYDKLVERIKELEEDLYNANCIIGDLLNKNEYLKKILEDK